MPHKIWAVGEEALAADFNAYVQNQTVPQFPNTAARDTWAGPPIGAQCITTDTHTVWTYTATGWKAIPARGRQAVTVDASGYGLIPHGLGVVPTVYFAVTGGPASGSPILGMVIAYDKNSTALLIRCFSQGGAALASVAVTVVWMAYP